MKGLALSSMLLAACLLTGCYFSKQQVEKSHTTRIQVPRAAVKKESKAKSQPLNPKDCTFIGDSVMLGAADSIKAEFPGSVVDAKESRQVLQAIDIVNGHLADHSLGKVVILALGTNGPFSADVGQQLLDKIGTKRQVYWVTAFGQHLQWQEQVNAQIRQLQQKNKNVRVVAWDQYASGNDSWFYDDGIHLNGAGRQAYARFLRAEMSKKQ